MEDAIQPFTQFGVAGLMGVLWMWERAYSRRREVQLDESHERLRQQQLELSELIDLVQRATDAIQRFEKTQTQLCQLLEKMHDDLRRSTSTAA
jgi:hypothetical protein